MEVEEDYLKELEQLLETKEWAQAEELVRKNKEKIIKDGAYSIIPMVCRHIREAPNHQLSALLESLCQELKPQESLIMILEACYGCQVALDPQFVMNLFPALKISLARTMSLKNFDWGLGEANNFNVIQSQSFYTSCEKMTESQPSSDSISKQLDSMDFFKAHTELLDWLLRSKTDVRFKRVVVYYILLTLDHPLAHLNLDLEDTMPHIYATRILKEYLPSVGYKLMPMFENYPPLELFQQPGLQKDANEDSEDDDKFKKSQNRHNLKDFPTPVGMGTLAYLIFCKNVASLPLIYTHRYLLECTMPFIIKLLEEKDVYAQLKGLELGCHFMTVRIQPDSLNIDFLDKDDFFKLPKVLFNIIRYNSVKMMRTKAREFLFPYFKAFQGESKFQLVMFLYRSCDSGPRGFLITIFKDTFHKEQHEANTKEKIFTKTENFAHFLLMILKLPDLQDYQLLKESDWLMGVLNFLYYLLLQSANPLKDVASCQDLPKVLKAFMTTVEKHVKESKDKFQAQVASLSEGDQTLNAIETRSALTYIDLMDSIIVQVQKLITEKRESLLLA